GWPGDWQRRMRRAIWMASHHQTRLRQQRLIGLLQLVVVVIWLVKNNFPDARLHGLFETVEAGACGHKEAGILSRAALARRQRDGILLTMHAEAILQSRAT